MGKDSAVNTLNELKKDNFVHHMRLGVDEVWDEGDLSLTYVLDKLNSEMEKLIGKEETLHMLLDLMAEDGFSTISLSETSCLGYMVERICRSLKVIGKSSVKWHVLLGRLYAEIDSYDDDEDDDEEDGEVNVL